METEDNLPTDAIAIKLEKKHLAIEIAFKEFSEKQSKLHTSKSDEDVLREIDVKTNTQ